MSKNDESSSKHLVLIRHGESQWNLENRFTGWVDVPLSPKGEQEAREAGNKLQAFKFDQAFTSVLSRAINTLGISAQGSLQPGVSNIQPTGRSTGANR